MNILHLPVDEDPQGSLFSRIAQDIHQKGYLVLDDVFPTEPLDALYIDIKASGNNTFHDAGIGREQGHQVNHSVRSDRIRWLEKHHQPALFYVEWIEQLRRYLNQELFLGLFDYECHYAHYPKGAFYKKHRDAFKGESNRVLTTILYLNPCWQNENGGELMLYAGDGNTVLEKVIPVFGRMVIFLSEEFPHEVLPATRSRYSLTGWFYIKE